MGSKGSAPAAPNYAELIPLQERSNINQFNTMLGASRINSQTPFGRQYWTPPPGFYGGQMGQNPAAPGTKTAQAAPDRGPAPPQYIDEQMGDGGWTQQAPNPAYQQWMQNLPGGQQGPQDIKDLPPAYQDANQGPWTFHQELSPEQQALYDQDLRIRGGMGNIGEQMMGGMGDIYGKPANFASQLPGYQYLQGPGWQGPQYNTNMNSRDAAEQAIYNRQMRFMQPDYAQRENQLHDRLTAQGFNMKDPGYANAMNQFQAQRDRAMADVRDQAILGGGQEATAELGRAMSAYQPAWAAGMQNQQFLSGQQNQALNYALQNLGQQRMDRATPLNELSAFRTGSQVQLPGTPGTASAPNLQAMDYLGAANQGYQNQLAGWNAEQAASGNFMGGLMNLAGTLGSAYMGMKSDRRLKYNITKIGQTPGGHNWYLWNWKDGGVGVGVVAQEVPEAAFVGPDGYLMVDYSKVL